MATKPKTTSEPPQRNSHHSRRRRDPLFDLTDTQRDCVYYLVLAWSIPDIADKVGVDEQLLHAWHRYSPAFIAELQYRLSVEILRDYIADLQFGFRLRDECARNLSDPLLLHTLVRSLARGRGPVPRPRLLSAIEIIELMAEGPMQREINEFATARTLGIAGREEIGATPYKHNFIVSLIQFLRDKLCEAGDCSDEPADDDDDDGDGDGDGHRDGDGDGLHGDGAAPKPDPASPAPGAARVLATAGRAQR